MHVPMKRLCLYLLHRYSKFRGSKTGFPLLPFILYARTIHKLSSAISEGPVLPTEAVGMNI
jgi:hypothetical protein